MAFGDPHHPMTIEDTIRDLVSGARVALPSDPNVWSDNMLTSFVEFGTPDVASIHRLNPEDVSRRFEEIRTWIRQVSDQKVNAVYMDTTTLYTARTLVLGTERDLFLEPATLLDLSNFVGNVVLFDHIFYLENSEIDPYELNEALGGEPVLISLPVESFGFSHDDDPVNSVGGLLRSLWYETDNYIQELSRMRGYEVLMQDAEEIKKSWRSIIDFVENAELWFDPLHKVKSDSYHSDGPQLLSDLTKIYNQSFDEAVYWRLSEKKPEGASTFVHSVIDECNYRSLFNTMVSNSLQLYYSPNTFRLPFRNFFHSKAVAIQRHLPSLRGIEREYDNAAKLYSEQSELRLPFFLAAVLNQIDSLDEFFEVLAKLRRQASSFRAHRAELDVALERNSTREIKKLRKALQDDSDTLRLKFPLAPVASGLAAVLATLTAGLSHTVLATIAILTAGSQFSSHYEKLKERALRPQYRFLTNMNETADGLTVSYPLISKLWGVDKYGADHFDRVFVKKLANFKSLQA